MAIRRSFVVDHCRLGLFGFCRCVENVFGIRWVDGSRCVRSGGTVRSEMGTTCRVLFPRLRCAVSRVVALFPGQGVGLGFFYAYRRSNTRTCHSMGSADLASVSFEKFRCFDGVGRIPVRQLHTPGDGHLVCVGQTISKTRGPQILLMDICDLGPPNFWPEKVVDFTMGF